MLSKEQISLEEIDNGVWEVRYGFYSLGIIKGKKMKLERATQWHEEERISNENINFWLRAGVYSFPTLQHQHQITFYETDAEGEGQEKNKKSRK